MWPAIDAAPPIVHRLPMRALPPMATACGNRGVAADVDVVGDLDEVVELDPVFYHRIFQCASVYRGVGADLHIVADEDPTHLGDLDPDAIVVGNPETIRSNHNPGVNDGAFTEHGAAANRDVGDEDRGGPDVDFPFEYAAGSEDGALPDADLRTDRTIGTDCGAVGHDCPLSHAGARVDPARRGGGGGEQCCRPRISRVGIAHHQTGSGRFLDKVLLHQHRGRTGTGQIGAIAAIVEKAQIREAGAGEAGDSLYATLRVSPQLRADDFGELPQRVSQSPRTPAISIPALGLNPQPFDDPFRNVHPFPGKHYAVGQDDVVALGSCQRLNDLGYVALELG